MGRDGHTGPHPAGEPPRECLQGQPRHALRAENAERQPLGLGAPFGSAIGALTADRWGRKPTIVTPFIVVSLFQGYGIAGVMALMIGLLLVQIVTVLALGVEPRQQSLEQIEPALGDGPEAERSGAVHRRLA